MAAMRALGWDAEPIAPDKSQGICVIDTPVRLKHLSSSDGVGRSIDFPARPVLACRFAIRIGQWARELAAPLAVGYLATELKAIETGPGFECRTRNREPNSKMSAHGSGIAIDIAGFDLANGKHVSIARMTSESEARFVAAVRAGACGWFTTILGPGSDAAHATHIHFDILQHGSSANYRICQ